MSSSSIPVVPVSPSDYKPPDLLTPVEIREIRDRPTGLKPGDRDRLLSVAFHAFMLHGIGIRLLDELIKENIWPLVRDTEFFEVFKSLVAAVGDWNRFADHIRDLSRLGDLNDYPLSESTADKPQSANDRQIGGQHWLLMKIQAWDYIVSNGLGYLEGNIVKYVSRWKRKGGFEDLRKARHYLDKLIETAQADEEK